MMAVRVSAGALLLVLLAAQSSSYPAKKGKGAYSSAGYDSMTHSGGPAGSGSGAGYGSGSGAGYGSGSGAGYGSGSGAGYGSGSGAGYGSGSGAGYGSGSGAGYGSGSGAGYGSGSGAGYGSGSGAGYGSGSGAGYGSGVGGPAATYSSGSFVGPAASGHSSFAGPAASVYFQPAARQGVAWSVEPPTFMSSEETSTSLGSLSNLSPAGYRPQYQGGELSQAQNIYEFGNSESETEDQGAHSSPDAKLGGPGFTSHPSGYGYGYGYGSGQAIYPYPYPYDYMFLTGQYAPGTVTHASSSFEQGRDNWEDIHYVWKYQPTPQEVQTFDAVKQPVKWPQGSTSGGSTGPNQPSVGGQASAPQAGRTTYPRSQIPPLPRLG